MPRGVSEIFNEVYAESGGGGTLLASAARTAAINSADQVNGARARGVKVVIDITAVGVTPGLTFTIQGKDPASGKYYTLLASASQAAVATLVMTVYPGVTAAANVTVNDALPSVWRVAVAVSNGVTATYSVGFSYLF